MFEINRLSSIHELESGLKLSSEQFQGAINNRADCFRKDLKMNEGEIVLLLQNNSIEFFINLFALFQLNATVIPLDPAASPIEIENVKKHSSAHFIISGKNKERIHSDANQDLCNIALLLYTSGTTGEPKGAMISYDALNEKMKVLSKAISAKEVSHTLCALPTFFGHGLICNSLFPLLNGETFTIAYKFDLKLCSNLPNIINENKITFFSSVPSVWHLILNFSTTESMPSLKRVHCASSPLSNDVAQEIQTWLGDGVNFYNTYGITEMSSWFACKKFSHSEDVNAFDDYWNLEKKYTSENELMVRSSYMFSGYLRNDIANKIALTDEGFFKTGDLFSDNSLKGRLNLVVNKKGTKIYPEEISQFLLKSEKLKDVYCFGKKDDFSNELLVALIVLKENETLQSVKDYCRFLLPLSKNPDFFIVTDSIQKNARGKVSKETIDKVIKEMK